MSQVPIVGAAIAFVISTTAFADAPPIQPLKLTEVASGLNDPVFVTHAPGDETRIFVVERCGTGHPHSACDYTGRIRILSHVSGELQPQDKPFLTVPEISTQFEGGLLGLAFHPEYAENGRYFVYFTSLKSQLVVREYQVSDDPDYADAANYIDLLVVPFTSHVPAHVAGWIDFGPDGFLYVAIGDVGSPTNGQDIETLPGSILRLNVDQPQPPLHYGIPRDNPFVGRTGRDEIWAYGLRNPWRSSFDRHTGDFYVADVGQLLWEEINYEPSPLLGGQNYGWACYEGHELNISKGLPPCPRPDEMQFPLHVYPNLFFGGTAVIGGYVYRGNAIPSLQGRYVFGDLGGSVWALQHDGTRVTSLTVLSDQIGSVSSLTSFGEDARGELYICSFNGGKIFRIDPVSKPGDLNGDGSVGVADLLILLNQWGECADCAPEACPGDLTGSCSVGVADLLVLLANWS